MATPRIVVNPFLNDFIYDIIYQATTEQKRGLPRRYTKKVRDSAATRKFVDRSYFEEKMEVLQSLGYSWFFIFFEQTKHDGRTLKEIFEKYRADEKRTPAQSLLENRMYVTSDRKFAHQLGLMADFANSPHYSQSLLLNKAGYHIQKWKKQMKAPINDMARDQMDISKYLVEMSLNMTIQVDYTEDFGMARNDFKILSYLYTKQHIFVDYVNITQRFSNNLTLAKITGSLRRLLNNSMISKTPKVTERKYQITALGINAIATFYKNVLKANEF